MKPGLKRIEATLHDLGIQSNYSSTETQEARKRPCSFRISITNKKQGENDKDSANSENHHVDTSINTENLFPKNNSVQAFTSPENPGQTPNLPKFKSPSFSNHRHGANPAFAITMLQEIQETVAEWQKELHTILQQIQNIYLEGPVINGWLEFNPPSSTPDKETPTGTATLRHGEVAQLMDYVQEICEPSPKVTLSSRTDYHLCGIDAAGKVWSRKCSVDEVPTVSMAIARYQKLRQLFARKQYLETRLNQLAENLVGLHSSIRQS